MDRELKELLETEPGRRLAEEVMPRLEEWQDGIKERILDPAFEAVGQGATVQEALEGTLREEMAEVRLEAGTGPIEPEAEGSGDRLLARLKLDTLRQYEEAILGEGPVPEQPAIDVEEPAPADEATGPGEPGGEETAEKPDEQEEPSDETALLALALEPASSPVVRNLRSMVRLWETSTRGHGSEPMLRLHPDDDELEVVFAAPGRFLDDFVEALEEAGMEPPS